MKEELQELISKDEGKLLSTYYPGKLDNLIVLADKHDKLLKSAIYLAALGTPIKPRKDFERAIRRALWDLQEAIKAIKLPDEPIDNEMSLEEKESANDLAKEFGIRPNWLFKELQ